MLSLFCCNVLLLPDRDRDSRMPLALFFMASAGELLALPVSVLFPASPPSFATLALELAEIPLTMAQPFLLWLYVHRLTADRTQPAQPQRLLWHLLPIGFACVVYVYVLLLPPALQAGLYPGAQSLGIWQIIAFAGFYGATAVFYVLIPIYAVLILGRLRRYRTRLKDLFASTEGRELAWAWWLTAAVCVFWLFNLMAILATELALSFPGVGLLDSLTAAILVRFGLIWSVALWGTRQRPGLVPPPARAPETRDPPPPPPGPLRKYGHSGLSDDRLDRIASKIDALMQDGKLYLEPDLSLWDLAERIGVTTHYASQALNEKIGLRFFDYVNGWRVREAADRLRSTDATILAIAYDVGFNSRSSFYTAFKREIGMTPSQYRSAA
ncbi:helix-turn-helix transcriptional regulator [Dinoroseobacter sp. S124A]|uniref:helix-turn-helix transcriptional regulator n=1 Tax=Dinoroseobacter sp. S124A TaxID=3415128 RepID=UPI003C7D4E40